MSRIKNFDDVVEHIKSHLVDYLEEQEINTKTNFNCIHSDHDDTVASCGVMRQSEFKKWHCFGCNEFGDIFDACAALEGKPVNGPEYIKETVLYLAEKYKIEVKMEEPTEEEKYRIETFVAYKKAAHYVAAHSNEKSLAELARRDWEPEGCKARLIGSVDSFQNYKEYMKNQGFSVSFLESIDLLNPYLFNENNLLFTVSDDYGRPCGFAARNLDYDSTNKNSRKYINTKNFGTDIKCQIFEKSKRLYNIHNAKKGVGSLYIVEGHGDVETAIQKGLEKAVCVGGTAFTDYHIIELSRMGITDITLCMDGDVRGQASLNRMLEKFINHKEFSLHVVSIPEDLDPDDYIRQYGVERFRGLKRWSAFEWKLNSFDDRIDTALIKKEVIPIISSESSPMIREEMATVLSERVEISVEAIKAEIEQLLDQTELKRSIERRAVLNTLSVDLKSCPSDWRLSMNKATQELESLSEAYNEDMFSPAAYLKDIELIQANEEEHDNSENTFEFQDWRELTDAVSGNWEATLNVIGGAANTGKCQRFDSEILLSDGSILTIEEVVKRKVQNGIMMKDHKLVPCKFTDWIDSGKLECFKIKTDSGLDTKPSETHPYYTLDGWKRVKDLKVGDRIAIAARYNIEGQETVSKEDARLIGYLLADGSTTKAFGFSNIDQELISDFKNICKNKWKEIKFRDDDNTCTYASDTLSSKSRRHLDWIENLGILGCGAHTKRVPKEIRMSTKELISEFLGAFYACDGWVYSSVDGVEIGVSLCNYDLIKDVRHLLLRLGIKSKINFSYATSEKGGKKFKKFTLSLSDARSTIKFFNAIKIPLKSKQERLEEIALFSVEKIKNSGRFAYSEYLPAELWNKIEELAEKRGETLSSLARIITGEIYVPGKTRKGNPRLKLQARHRFDKKNRINPELFKTIAENLGDEFLISIANGDIAFDKITEITSIGKHQCYDLTVPGEHNFICNDTVVHNTGLMAAMALQLARNEDNNALVIFHTIDDTVPQFTTRLVCQYAQELMPNITLNMIKNPNGFASAKRINAARQYGYQEIKKLVQQGRLIVRGGEQGKGANTLSFAQEMIRYYKKMFPDKRIIYFLDNFHRLRDFANMDERLRFKALSNATKDMAKKENIPVWATMEYNKAGAWDGRPTNNSIAESAAMEYDANVIVHIYNDLHHKGDDADLFFWRTDAEGRRYKAPRIELIFGKNKISSFKGKLYFDFHTEQSRYIPVPASMVQQDLEIIKLSKEEEQKNRYRNAG